MDSPITKQDILDLLARQAKQFDENLRRSQEEVRRNREETRKELEERALALKKELEERELALKKELREKELALEKELQEKELALEKELRETKEKQRIFEAKLQKSKEEREKMNQEFTAWLARSNKDFYKKLKEATKEIGGIGRTLGAFAESAVMPRILELFEERGIHIESSYQHIKRKDKQNQPKYEIDLFLANGKYVVAVEVKIEVSKRDVDKHLERLVKIQQDPPKSFDLQGVSLLGGIAGMILEEGIANYAMKKGLFVINQSGDNIKIANSQQFQPKEWKVGNSNKEQLV